MLCSIVPAPGQTWVPTLRSLARTKVCGLQTLFTSNSAPVCSAVFHKPVLTNVIEAADIRCCVLLCCCTTHLHIMHCYGYAESNVQIVPACAVIFFVLWSTFILCVKVNTKVSFEEHVLETCLQTTKMCTRLSGKKGHRYIRYLLEHTFS